MTALPEWIKQIQRDYRILEKDGMMSKERVEYQTLQALAIAWEALEFLHQYTYTDAEGPELRAQNQRTHTMTKDAMRRITELGEGII